MTSSLLGRLRELTALPGPSGHEREVALAFAKHLRAHTDDVVLDPFGNVIGTIRGDVVPLINDGRPGRARDFLIGLQVSASALLLISAAVFLRSA